MTPADSRWKEKFEHERRARLEAEDMLSDRLRTLHGIRGRLEAANRELEDFAYVASHDLRAPLRAIEHLSKWIVEDLGGAIPDSSRAHLDLLRGRVARMECLLDDLLKYARVGRVAATVEPVDTGSLVRGLAAILCLPAGFALEVESNMPMFSTAKTPLEQVFRNLVDNAIKHHDRERGRIVVRGRDSDATWVFEVEDDGPGVPAGFRPKLFRPFQRARSRDEKEGSGMGLAMIRKIVELHGGVVECAPGNGRGALFRFTWAKTPEGGAP